MENLIIEGYNTYAQIIAILFTAIYGLAYGIRNWSLFFVMFVGGGSYTQSDFGKILDATWIVVLIGLIAIR